MLNGHPPTLMEEAEKKGVEVGMVPLPGEKGPPTQGSMGVADWIMGFKQNGHRVQIGKFFNFLFNDKNVIEFADMYDLLPVTDSASAAMETTPSTSRCTSSSKRCRSPRSTRSARRPGPRRASRSRRTSARRWSRGSSPETVLGRISREATAAEAAE